MNPEDKDEALLRELFRKDTPELPDNGFSLRVLRALPRQRRSSPWLIGSLEAAASLLVALAAAAFASNSPLSQPWLNEAGSLLLAAIEAPAITLALATACASLVITYAFLRWQTH